MLPNSCSTSSSSDFSETQPLLQPQVEQQQASPQPGICDYITHLLERLADNRRFPKIAFAIIFVVMVFGIGIRIYEDIEGKSYQFYTNFQNKILLKA